VNGVRDDVDWEDGIFGIFKFFSNSSVLIRACPLFTLISTVYQGHRKL
jgi:hypothetical protein